MGIPAKPAIDYDGTKLNPQDAELAMQWIVNGPRFPEILGRKLITELAEQRQEAINQPETFAERLTRAPSQIISAVARVGERAVENATIGGKLYFDDVRSMDTTGLIKAGNIAVGTVVAGVVLGVDTGVGFGVGEAAGFLLGNNKLGGAVGAFAGFQVSIPILIKLWVDSWEMDK